MTIKGVIIYGVFIIITNDGNVKNVSFHMKVWVLRKIRRKFVLGRTERLFGLL
jgi:hypothetical protein